MKVWWNCLLLDVDFYFGVVEVVRHLSTLKERSCLDSSPSLAGALSNSCCLLEHAYSSDISITYHILLISLAITASLASQLETLLAINDRSYIIC